MATEPHFEIAPIAARRKCTQKEHCTKIFLDESDLMEKLLLHEKSHVFGFMHDKCLMCSLVRVKCTRERFLIETTSS